MHKAKTKQVTSSAVNKFALSQAKFCKVLINLAEPELPSGIFAWVGENGSLRGALVGLG
jgi:hypothetical protein